MSVLDIEALAGLQVRNLLIVGQAGRRERLPEEITHAAWHRISFAEDGPTTVRETGEVLWPDVLPIPDELLDGIGLRAKFADTRRVLVPRRDGTPHYLRRPGAATGGRDPYALLVRTDGTIDQLAEIGEVTPHAAVANRYALGIAVAGDFRPTPKRSAPPPTLAQWRTCVTLAALLGSWGLQHQGHTEIEGASEDPDKVCPGSGLSMVTLRTAAAQHPCAGLSRYEAEVLLIEAGIVL